MQHMRAIFLVRSARIIPTFMLAGIVSLEEARASIDAWKGRLAPKRIAVRGGNQHQPQIDFNHRACKTVVPKRRRMFVTNGFFLDRHPDLPAF